MNEDILRWEIALFLSATIITLVVGRYYTYNHPWAERYRQNRPDDNATSEADAPKTPSE
ncbi:MAG: hypothetical protein AAF125_08125 [Chloroflexota bacterium]